MRCCAGACSSSTWRKAVAARWSGGWRPWPGPVTPVRCGAALGPAERDWLGQVKSIDVGSLSEKLRHNLPDWLAGALRKELPDDDFWALVGTLEQQAPLDLRVNVLKADRDGVRQALAEHGIEAEPTPYSPWGLADPGQAGAEQAGALHPRRRGGAGRRQPAARPAARREARRNGGGFLRRRRRQDTGPGRRHAQHRPALCVRHLGHRLDALKPRLARSGLSNVYPAQIAHERDDRIKRLAGKIDRVLVDAPCSGLGTLRRNPDLKWRQSPQAVVELGVKQRAILDSAARLLKPGGRLVYATCSLLRDENEAVAAAFSAAHADFRAAGRRAAAGQGLRGPAGKCWPATAS